MAVVLVLFRETNVAAMTSCETVLSNVYREILISGEGLISKQKSLSIQLIINTNSSERSHSNIAETTNEKNVFGRGARVGGMVLTQQMNQKVALISYIQTLVVQTLDSANHWINHYPADSVIDFRNIYPLDSDLSGGF